MGAHGLHKWWYRCLQRAGIVAEGVTHGRKMHMARHTAPGLRQTGQVPRGWSDGVAVRSLRVTVRRTPARDGP
jgi:hypothetical protein